MKCFICETREASKAIPSEPDIGWCLECSDQFVRTLAQVNTRRRIYDEIKRAARQHQTGISTQEPLRSIDTEPDTDPEVVSRYALFGFREW